MAYTYNGILLSLKMENLTQATTWRKLENAPREIGASQKNKYYVISLTQGVPRVIKLTDRKQNGGCRG